MFCARAGRVHCASDAAHNRTQIESRTMLVRSGAFVSFVLPIRMHVHSYRFPFVSGAQIYVYFAAYSGARLVS